MVGPGDFQAYPKVEWRFAGKNPYFQFSGGMDEDIPPILNNDFRRVGQEIFPDRLGHGPGNGGHGPDSGTMGGLEHIPDYGRSKLIGRQRNEGPKKFRMLGDVLLELKTVMDNGLAGYFPQVLYSLDIKVRFLYSDLERKKAVVG
jgi:hypothetical protein